MTARILDIVTRLRSDRRGVSTMEYGVLAAAVITAVIAAGLALEGHMTAALAKITTALK